MELITKYGGRAKVPWNIIGDNMVYVRICALYYTQYYSERLVRRIF